MLFLLLAVMMILPAATVNAQAPSNDPVLMTIAGTSITRSEFEKVYRKNNNKEGATDMDDLREYLDLYINYKLKVKEAEEEKMDTSAAFINELKGYRKQLAQPYLSDKEVTDALIKEAYDRMQKDVRASHILINVAPDALPKDTIFAYNRIMKIRDMILKGADFGKVAKDSSNDQSARENNGDLGYFTGMQMVYPFETAAYNTPVGQISMPVRTKFGYHIIKVIDVRAAQGEIKVAHIMIKSPAAAPDSVSRQAKQKIDEIYAKLQAGEKFEDLAMKFSDDKGSAKSGGALPPFGTGRMVPEFEKAAFDLKNDGDFSQPVKTSYGWHIIKRLEKKPVPSFEQKKNELKTQVARDSRAEVSKNSMITRIKKDYGFKEVPKNKDLFINSLDSTVVKGEWTTEKAVAFDKPLFTLGTKTYTQKDFATYVANHQSKRANTTPKQVGNTLYGQFVEESCLSYEESQLENKYPEFKALIQEYRDGILLFDLTDKKVWSKAVKDTAGLKAFYETNKNNYMWETRCDAVIYTCANASIASKARKMLKKNYTSTDIQNELNKDSQLNFSVKEGLFLKGENAIVDSIQWVKGMTPDMNRNNSVVFVNIKEVLAPTPKTLEEAKGVVTADYQNYLEKEWIAQLRAKYPVQVNQEVVNSFAK